MNDRLNDLRKGGAASGGGGGHEDGAFGNNPPSGGTYSLVSRNGGENEPTFMNDFFECVEMIKSNILAIQNATRRVSEIRENVVLATMAEKEAAYSAELTPLLNETNKKATFIKNMLKRLEEENQSKGNETQASELRIRKNLLSTLTRKFVDVMKEYQNAQQEYKTDIRKKVKRHVQIVKPEATTEEIDAVMKSGTGSGGVLKTAILNGDTADPIRNAYINVADKYQDVIALEASIAELHQMFLDFAMLTEQQGELLDQIEQQVKNATDYIDDANANMNQAIEYQKQIRGKQCCLLMIFLIIIGVIVGIIFGVVKMKKG